MASRRTNFGERSKPANFNQRGRDKVTFHHWMEQQMVAESRDFW